MKQKQKQWFIWDATKLSDFNKTDFIVGYIDKIVNDRIVGTAVIDKRGYECPHGVSFEYTSEDALSFRILTEKEAENIWLYGI